MLLIVDCGSSKTPEFTRIATELGIAHTTLSLAEAGTALPANCSHIVVSGAPILVTETNPNPYKKQFEPLLAVNCPLLGVCFGHQILGLLHGASARRCSEARSWEQLQLHHASPLFEGFEVATSMMEDHCECIDLPPNWRQLASSATCTNEAMQHPSKPWFGVQFHPEVSGPAGVALLKNFLAQR